MPTRDEIREGIKEILCANFKDPIDTDCPYCIASRELIQYLHSKGLMRKAKCPNCA